MTKAQLSPIAITARVKMRILPAAQVHDDREIAAGTEALLSGRWASGKFAEEFSRRLGTYLGTRYSLLCNSGSSANLLAVSALTSPLLKERRLRKGDIAIVAATSFPTTVAPVIQNGLIPMFVDIDRKSCCVTPESLRECLSHGPKLVIIAHTLGNPYDLGEFRSICDDNGIWLIEDNCDALGSSWNGKRTGSIGDISTQSFYPAHHISTGEGGAVSTSNPLLKRILESFRDWGRDCWCDPGKDNTCGKRFDHDEWESMPHGYDHKYTYTHIGYNLKMTDIQAAIGCAQMDKLNDFIQKRRRNHTFLKDALERYDEFLEFQHELPGGWSSWFGFLITVKEGAPFTRREMVSRLEERGVMTRMLFGGNLYRQPAYRSAVSFTFGALYNANYMMENSFWIGCHPKVDINDMLYIRDTIGEFIREYSHSVQ